MIKLDTFEKLVESIIKAEEQRINFENNLEKLLGEDSNVIALWITDPLWDIFKNILLLEMGESEDGFYWFQEHLDSISKGKCSNIWTRNRKENNWNQYDICSAKDYYDYLNGSLKVSKVIADEDFAVSEAVDREE